MDKLYILVLGLIWYYCCYYLSLSLMIKADECIQDNLPTGLMGHLWYSNDSEKFKIASLNCTAIIIHPNWLLTPASCLFDYTNPYRYQVELQSFISQDPLVVKKVNMIEIMKIHYSIIYMI